MIGIGTNNAGDGQHFDRDIWRRRYSLLSSLGSNDGRY